MEEEKREIRESKYMDELKTRPIWILLLSFLGLLFFLKHTASILRWLFITFLRPAKNLKKYGSWALITAPTEGIGKSFAFELARKGLNLILVGRNINKLQNVTRAIQSEYPNIQIKIVVVDFSSSDLSVGIRKIEEAIAGLDVGVLINNVGITYPSAKFFHAVDEEIWMNIIRVNIEGTTRVTMAVLPGMLKRKKGAIVNIGSGAAIVVPSHPLFAIYAASKAYVDQWSRSIHVEYKDQGIDVQCQVPLYVATKMVSKVASIEKSSLFVPSPDAYVRSAVRRIGHGEPRCTPYWTHSIQWCFAYYFIPEFLLDAWRLSIGLHRICATERL
ncbi:hypothetical protein C5167_018092 [Papaver somniferum]|uniref:Uncharacterized protein n=1 Tax=Papaver somniferum TaxID=3469 RepID=A0A4Y7IQ73_PAPSO|nr:very-long-chain 3-oxoacyl-CoA reductase-like protein At1g24470 [Papaver somniferum]RZC49649.1 hypothetical protein C5167_018092 [Papaver somniferum]